MAEIDAPRTDIETFAADLVDDTVAEIRGSHLGNGDHARSGITPRTTWFGGAIVPVDPDSDISETIQSRVSPSTIGLIGSVTPDEDGQLQLDVGISFAVYFRVVPRPDTYRNADTDGLPVVFKKREVGPIRTTVTLPSRVTAVGFDDAVRRAEEQIETAVADNYSNIYDEILDDPLLYGEGDDDAYRRLYDRVSSGDDDDPGESFEAVAERANFTGDPGCAPRPQPAVTIRLIEGVTQDAPTESTGEESAVVRVDLENATDIDPDDDHTYVDRGMYEAKVTLRPGPGSTLEEIAFEDLPDNFRYDPTVPGHGYNCTVEPTDDGDGIRTETLPVWRQPYFEHHELSTAAQPSFESLVDSPVNVLYALSDEMVDWGAEEWAGTLEDHLDSSALGIDDITAPGLEGSYEAISELLHDVFNPDRKGILVSDITEGDRDNGEVDDAVAALETVLTHIEEYRDEIDRFVTGIDLVERNDTVRELFIETNEVFQSKVAPTASDDEDAEPEYTSWRPFQMVYIVTQLPDLVARDPEFDGRVHPDEHRRDTVSLLHFPTGGGKTEAYLALVVFAALYDRRHGKEFGLTAMMRFPLRLLSLQQFQRVVEILVHADEKRKDAGYGGEPFSAGYFSGATANRTAKLLQVEYGDRIENRTRNDYPPFPTDENRWETNRDALNWLSLDWGSGELERIDEDDYRMVERCPLCGYDVQVEFNPRSARIEHRCSAPDHICGRDTLEVYVTDQDIYRMIPTMLLGTQDKLAAIGYNYRSRTLAGHVRSYCPEHGYSPTENCIMSRFCAVDGEGEVGSDTNDLEDVTPTRPAPTLTIQDELHLINEDLGTFESHYYAAFEKHIEWACDDSDSLYLSPKKLAATATIEEYENQIRHLYQQDATLFPARGPEYRETFYAGRDYDRTQRRYIGIVPWNRSQINSIMRLLYRHQAKLQRYLESPEEYVTAFDFEELDDPDVFEDLITHYLAMVTYVISRAEGGRIYKSTDNQVNDNLQRDGLEPIERAQITGGTDFREIQQLLDNFEQLGTPGGLAYDDIDELIVATSSISHGVDLETLNWMTFFNAPPQMSEYIQASSRVGRKYPGIVLNIFDPIKVRDRSHYHYFQKYHEYQDRLVQPVPLNRWAKFSIEYTLPGLLMSLLYIRYFDDIDAALGENDRFGNKPSREQLANVREQGLLETEQIIEDLLEIYGEEQSTGECPFEEDLRGMVERTFATIDGAEDITDADEALEGSLMFSLRQVDDQVPIYLDDDDEDALEVL